MPARPAGAVKVAENPPAALVVEAPNVSASKVSETVVEGPKPVPVTVNEAPDTPLAGLMIIEAVTENVLDAEWDEASVEVTV